MRPHGNKKLPPHPRPDDDSDPANMVPFPDEQGSGMRGQLVSFGAVQQFALAGSATFTVVSTATGKRYTFKVKRPDDFNEQRPIWFVSVLRGPDNEDDYTYIGNIRSRNGLYEYERGNKCSPGHYHTSDLFLWFWRHVQLNPDQLGLGGLGIEIWHEGRCGRCNRKLTVPESVASGFGPECINYVGG